MTIAMAVDTSDPRARIIGFLCRSLGFKLFKILDYTVFDGRKLYRSLINRTDPVSTAVIESLNVIIGHREDHEPLFKSRKRNRFGAPQAIGPVQAWRIIRDALNTTVRELRLAYLEVKGHTRKTAWKLVCGFLDALKAPTPTPAMPKPPEAVQYVYKSPLDAMLDAYVPD